jgi:ABC-type transporter Mla subunit MlaD
MKAVLIAVTVLLAGCIAGLVITYQSLGTTHDRLDDLKVTLQATQTEQRENQESLAETQDKLNETEKALEDTMTELQEQKNQTDNYTQMYEGKLKELEATEAELDAAVEDIEELRQSNDELQDFLNEMQEKLDLYEDTLGTEVFSGMTPPYHSGSLNRITLVNQDKAQNPTWRELLVFLRADKTDKKLYIPGDYVCGGFAQDVHNNAEAQGIRAAFVVVHFQDKNLDSHALNAFKTVDKGLVYIDCTGSTSIIPAANLDKSVEMTKGEPYVETMLFPEGWIFIPDTDIVESIEIYW